MLGWLEMTPTFPVPALALVATLLSVLSLSAQNSSGLAASVQAQLPALSETYKQLHRNPELSHHEEKTSAYLAAELRKAGYTVTEHMGKYQDGSQANGIVAVMENGAGPRLLIRSDMGALPMEEKTGLDYASTVRTTNPQGQDVGVMHACGHDIHMTVCCWARPAKWQHEKASGTARWC
jgi:hippurate hydrolase